MTRKIFLFLILFVFTTQFFSQPRPHFAGTVETNLIQTTKDTFSLYISYRLPYSELIFSKENSHFTSGAEFFCEIYNGDNLIGRKSIDDSVSVNSYSETLDENTFIQAVIEFKLGKAKYIIKPSIQKYNTQMQFPYKEIELELLNNEKKLRPLIIENKPDSVDFTLLNTGNIISYDEKKYGLLIPVPDSSSNIKVTLEQNNLLLLDTLVTDKQTGFWRISKNDDRIVVNFNRDYSAQPETYIPISLPASIDEGDLQIKLEMNGKKKIYNIPVVWLKKPLILGDLDLAINLMSIIIDSKRVEYLLNQPSDKKYMSLKKEWNTIIHPGEGPLNRLMKEFYLRADYSLNNFSIIGQRNGALSDRGKIYIQFGKPDNIEREYKNKYETTEIWYYENLKREFIFEDTSGKGNYLLRK